MTASIVVVGASLGGLDATGILLEGLPASFPCPLVLAQHRREDGESRLVELLNGRSSRPVVEPDDKEAIRPDRVYLAPPGYHLIVERGFFSLSLDAPVLFARPSIDVLFESAAVSYGAATIAVLLTNSNEDGAAGTRAVKAAGGRVVVQDPETARAPAGPRAAIAQTAVDWVLPLEEIAGRLVLLCGSGAPGTL